MEYYGQLDLTVLGNIVRAHPEAVKTVAFKDGTTHKFINISICERKNPDQYGRTHYAKAGIKREQQRQGVNYFFSDLKPSQQAQAPQPPQQQAPPPTNADGKDDDLPF